ncbi:RWD-domain-containing protein [Dissoconium aciculare CBS 342.82]|uniref:RBR-type E3 ubiquitin transferase n=1 Tax=Dissoconium aciculare CBS 342.82 TaxID=1314786 RepID=A0A6J3MIF4_9PEZI|nr:RWD-domain-containing protein [Dissoconium aciculare CBS 342.82]KAF1827484.1 RWD-domain-containing protein [Dissoconium aciculare CBS 342.82]
MAASPEDEERREELESLAAIFPELIVDTSDPEVFSACIELAVSPSAPLLIRFQPSFEAQGGSQPATARKAVVEHDLHLSHLPPITLQVKLPRDYPVSSPPEVRLSTHPIWLPQEKKDDLEKAAAVLWEDYGRCQILFSYIDHLQQAAERGFDLADDGNGCLSLSSALEDGLVSYNSQKRREIFEAGTYDCGVCLDPKKGTMCYQMKHCGHIYCRQCLQDFYNNAITEGDISGVRCMHPECDKDSGATEGRRTIKKERLVHPSELLDMGIDEAVVRRFVEMKRKKRLEADKSTVYCPRTWCQGAAKSAKYPPIPADLRAYVAEEMVSDGEQGDNAAEPHVDNKSNSRIPPNPSDRLAVCEKCSFAFCQVCYMGWHGPFARCFPRDPNELSAEEKASYEYIRLHTSPCAYCNVPVQKTMGCNHMRCFQCNTHFCYLCGAWLEPANPYQHFNKEGTPCFQRLWELEEGDDGQAPRDGGGFAGGRGWEQLAIEVARAADEAEDAAAAAALQAQEEEEDRDVEHLFPNAPDPPHIEVPLQVAMAQVQLVRELPPGVEVNARRGPRRARNPFPAMPNGNGAAQRVREHERGARRRPAVARPDELENRQQAELQRFLEMAQRDEEDGWDSDELGDNDEGFMIR